MNKIAALIGTDAIAEAMRQINPDVVAAYPITPQTAIVETFSQMVADGEASTVFINVESEHSAMSACVGAAAGGARVMTCTSSQGLALMWEILYIASGLRLPIVMPNVNRTLSAPINIHCDHSDSMGARDSGWIQLFSATAQEAYDNTIQALRIAEHKDVLLPVMVNLDGFIISHSMERVGLLEDREVKEFVGTLDPAYTLLDAHNPISVGGFDSFQGYFFEFKRAQEEAMKQALRVVEEVGGEFGRKFGRPYGFFESYQMDDASLAFVVLGSAAGTVKDAINSLRERGLPAGLLKLRLFRPFPVEALREALKHVPVVAVLDRSTTFAGGVGGPVWQELRSAFYDYENKPRFISYIYGLGGRDFGKELIENVAEELLEGNCPPVDDVRYLGLREVQDI